LGIEEKDGMGYMWKGGSKIRFQIWPIERNEVENILIGWRMRIKEWLELEKEKISATINWRIPRARVASIVTNGSISRRSIKI
jgi:hypothetical protein